MHNSYPINFQVIWIRSCRHRLLYFRLDLDNIIHQWCLTLGMHENSISGDGSFSNKQLQPPELQLSSLLFKSLSMLFMFYIHQLPILERWFRLCPECELPTPQIRDKSIFSLWAKGFPMFDNCHYEHFLSSRSDGWRCSRGCSCWLRVSNTYESLSSKGSTCNLRNTYGCFQFPLCLKISLAREGHDTYIHNYITSTISRTGNKSRNII